MDPADSLENAKSASVVQLLLLCARRLDELAIERMRDRRNLPGLRRAHTALIPHIDLDGTRPTEIARRVGVSKQAVGELLNELEGMGLLERVPDPSDRRAVLVRFVGGADAILAGLAVLGELEQEIAGHVGVARVSELRRTLLLLQAWVDGPGAGGASPVR